MFNEHVELDCTSSGHYCIDISGNNSAEVEAEDLEVLLLQDAETKKERLKKLVKLHKQFGHASEESLTKLIRNSGVKNVTIFKALKEVVDNCETCMKYKKPPPRPVVGLPLADDFNQTVAMDLHELSGNLYYFHMIDEFSRFSAACIIKSKQASVIVLCFIKYWIAVHGAPKMVLSDNGKEFENEEFRDMCENFNIEVRTTAAFSPWSNGTVERHNQTLTNILKKVKADRNCDWETALSWALFAKNSLSNVSGYSPY